MVEFRKTFQPRDQLRQVRDVLGRSVPPCARPQSGHHLAHVPHGARPVAEPGGRQQPRHVFVRKQSSVSDTTTGNSGSNRSNCGVPRHAGGKLANSQARVVYMLLVVSFPGWY